MKLNLVLLFFSIVFFTQITSAQNLNDERIVHRNILRTMKNEIKEHYFDPTLRGIDIEDEANKAGELIKKANSVEEMNGILFGFLLLFNDPHLVLMPAKNEYKTDYGWKMMFIGDKTFVTQVDEDSDAMKKGVRSGDQVYMFDGFIPTRNELWKLIYTYEFLNPKALVNIIIIKPNGKKFRVEVASKITKAFLKDNLDDIDRRAIQIEEEEDYFKNTKQSFYDKIPGLLVWKLPTFEIKDSRIDQSIDRAKKSKALILDLRGNDELSETIWKSRIIAHRNEGIYQNLVVNNFPIVDRDLAIIALKRFCANLFNKEIAIGELRGRKKTQSLSAKSVGNDYFSGEIVVLIDSETGGMSEAAARILQIKKRAKIIGDSSAGSVMRTKFYSDKAGIGYVMPFGLTVPTEDFFLSDGKHLDQIGITPDEKILPTALDLLNGRDPVMFRAAQILGFNLTPEEAGKLFHESDKK